MSDNTKITPGFTPASYVPVGGVILKEGNVNYNVGRPAYKLKVRNTGDRPVQVGSHLHFFEANRYLEFDRDTAFGCHLNIPATTAIRFEPGEEKEVEVVPFGGKRRIIGFNNLTDGYAGPEDTPSYYPVRNRLPAPRKVRIQERAGRRSRRRVHHYVHTRNTISS